MLDFTIKVFLVLIYYKKVWNISNRWPLYNNFIGCVSYTNKQTYLSSLECLDNNQYHGLLTMLIESGVVNGSWRQTQSICCPTRRNVCCANFLIRILLTNPVAKLSNLITIIIHDRHTDKLIVLLHKRLHCYQRYGNIIWDCKGKYRCLSPEWLIKMFTISMTAFNLGKMQVRSVLHTCNVISN